MKLVDMRLENEEEMNLFHEFYFNVFVNEFPPDEIGTYEQFLELKSNAKSIPNYEYHIMMFVENGVAISILMFDHFMSLNSVVVEFCVVRDGYRRRGLASKIMSDAVQALGDVQYLFGEVEKDNIVNRTVWKKNHLKRLDFDYVQLPLDEGKSAVDCLYFCVRQFNEEKEYLPSDFILNVVYNYYRYAMLYDAPEETEIYKELEAQLAQKSQIAVLDLI